VAAGPPAPAQPAAVLAASPGPRLVEGEVAEAEDRQGGEEPPLQAVEEVRSFTEVRLRGESQRLGRGRRLADQVDEPAVDRVVQRRRDLDAGDRARRGVGDLGRAAGRVDAHPAGDRDLSGRRVGGRERVDPAVVGLEPAAVHQDGRSLDGAQRGHQVDPGDAVAGAVADDDGVLGDVGPTGLDPTPLVGARDRTVHRQHVRDGHGRGVEVGQDQRVALLAVLLAVELPLPEGVRQVAERRDRDREEQPSARQEESHASSLRACGHAS